MNDTTAAKALVKAQSEMGAVIKNTPNPHLKRKYADLGAVLDACAEALHSNGFAILQPIGQDEFGPYVETLFLHETGAEFRSRVHLLMGKTDMQALGSAITYARRYGLLAMAGLAPEDDDGEATRAQPRQAPEPRLVEPRPPAFNAGEEAARILRLLPECRDMQGLLDMWSDHREEIIRIQKAAPDTHAMLVEAFKARKAAVIVPLPPAMAEAVGDDLRGTL